MNQKTLEIIQPNSGGYQLASSETLGYQILIDYRSRPIPRVASLTDILNAKDGDLQTWVRDRIVLIGYLSGDEHPTPTGKQPGVMIHAYLVSQVLRTVVNHPPHLLPWPKPIEALWIAAWAAIANWLIWHRPISTIPYKRVILIVIGTVLIVLGGSSLFEPILGVGNPPECFTSSSSRIIQD
jgi:CHASE2 domain-containing sensor protein